LKAIFRPIEARRNEIRSHLSVPAAKSSDWPPRSFYQVTFAGTQGNGEEAP